MKKLIYIALAVLLLIFGYLLYTSDEVVETGADTEPRVGENLEGEADPSRMTLTMTEWRWQHTLYNDGKEVRPAEFGTFTLTFKDDGSFSARTDCNSAGGLYTASEGTISFTNVASTLMYCEGSQESEFMKTLNEAQGYHFTSRGELILDLKFDSGTAVFR